MSAEPEKPIEAIQTAAAPQEKSFVSSIKDTILGLIKGKQNNEPSQLTTGAEPPAQKPDRLEMLKHSREQHQETLSKEERIELSWEFLDDITNKVDVLHGKVLEAIMKEGRTLTKNEVSYIHDDNPPHLRSMGKQTSINKELSSH